MGEVRSQVTLTNGFDLVKAEMEKFVGPSAVLRS